jgi:sarcosine oxidase, subunit alpha
VRRITRHPIITVPEGRRSVDFSFDGSSMAGYEGEMLSSALFANGIKRFSIHAKGDSPQGIFCANGQCSQCTVIVDGLPKKACITPLTAGLEVRTLRGLPELLASNRPSPRAKSAR